MHLWIIKIVIIMYIIIFIDVNLYHYYQKHITILPHFYFRLSVFYTKWEIKIALSWWFVRRNHPDDFSDLGAYILYVHICITLLINYIYKYTNIQVYNSNCRNAQETHRPDKFNNLTSLKQKKTLLYRYINGLHQPVSQPVCINFATLYLFRKALMGVALVSKWNHVKV